MPFDLSIISLKDILDRFDKHIYRHTGVHHNLDYRIAGIADATAGFDIR